MRKGRNIIWAYFTSPLFFAVGVVGAYLLVHNFCSRLPKSIEAITSKVDSTVNAVSTQSAASVNNKFTSKKSPPKVGKDVSQLQPQKGRLLARNNPPPIQSNPQALKNAANLSYEYTIAIIKYGNIWIFAFTGLIILIAAFFAKKDNVLNASETDMDPPELELLFKEFKYRIDLFRNPRKVLRFINLVKYHYYFLTKNDLGNIENLRKMMWILLEIQDDHEFVNIDGIEPEELSHANWFYKRIQNKPWHAESRINESDKELLMIILKLNVDMGS